MEIEFVTTDSNCLMLWKSQEDIVGNGDDFVLIYIEDGFPGLQYELGGGTYK